MSVNDLNSALGDTAIIFDQDLLESATFLRERFGLSEGAVANITQESLATGRSLENIKDEQLASLVAAEKTLQVNLNTNKALEKANSISGALRLNLEQAPGGLVKAVAQATALGLEIGQTAKMAGKLLFSAMSRISLIQCSMKVTVVPTSSSVSLKFIF